MSYSVITYSGELYHHGVLGQKWGVRRYQNKDGSLTEKGKKRYEERENRIKKNGNRLSSLKKQTASDAEDLASLKKDGVNSPVFKKAYQYYTDEELKEELGYANKQEALDALISDIKRGTGYDLDEIKDLEKENKRIKESKINERTIIEAEKTGKNIARGIFLTGTAGAVALSAVGLKHEVLTGGDAAKLILGSALAFTIVGSSVGGDYKNNYRKKNGYY